MTSFPALWVALLVLLFVVIVFLFARTIVSANRRAGADRFDAQFADPPEPFLIGTRAPAPARDVGIDDGRLFHLSVFGWHRGPSSNCPICNPYNVLQKAVIIHEWN